MKLNLPLQPLEQHHAFYQNDLQSVEAMEQTHYHTYVRCGQ